jgi:hypothetical protein
VTVLPPTSKFPEVDQADAGGELAKIYDDIQFALRVPWAPFAIRVMSLFPAFVPGRMAGGEAADLDCARRKGCRPGA